MKKLLRIYNRYLCWIREHQLNMIEYFSWKNEDGFGYNRLVVFKCPRCGVYCFSRRWAFSAGSGALENFPGLGYEIRDRYFPTLTPVQATEGLKEMLSKYFTVKKDTWTGIEISQRRR